MANCFICNRNTPNIYYEDGTPMCSTCMTHYKVDRVRCQRCGVSQKNVHMTYAKGVRCCINCAQKLSQADIDDESTVGKIVGETTKYAVGKFYKDQRSGEYYKETSPLPIVQSFIHLVIIFVVLVHGLNQASIILKIFEVSIGIIFILLLIIFATIRIKIYDNEIRCLYGPFTYLISKKEITKAEFSDASKFFGYGLIISWNKSLILKFITGNEPGVILRKKSGFFKSVFISSPNPTKLLEHIAKKMY